jgi:hypothetical protein
MNLAKLIVQTNSALELNIKVDHFRNRLIDLFNSPSFLIKGILLATNIVGVIHPFSG